MSPCALIASVLSGALPWRALRQNNHCSINTMISIKSELNSAILIISWCNQYSVLEFWCTESSALFVAGSIMSVHCYQRHWLSYTLLCIEPTELASVSFLAGARAVLDHSDAVSIAQNIQQYQQCFIMLGYPFRTSFQVALGYFRA